MEKEVVWISYNNIYLEWIKNQIPSARLGLLVKEFTQDTITSVQQLKTSSNNVFIDAQYSLLKDEHIQMCINSKIPLEVWTINASTAFTTIHPYISGITTDQLLPSNNK